jgi:integral membrane protein (TIGR00529 family)
MVDILFEIPYVVRVIASLLLILVINKYLKQLSVSIFAGTVVLAFWTGHTISSAGTVAWTRMSSADSLLLMLIIFQIIWLSSQMKVSGAMKKLVEVVKNRLSNRAALAVLPAVIGLLPMPGGAVFSAPMVDDVDSGNKIAPMLKTEINYWFRHIWEYWWPLYPGVVLAADLAGLPITTFMLLNIWLSILSVIAGYIFLLRKVPVDKRNKNHTKSRISDIIMQLSPVIIIVLVYAGIKMIQDNFFQLPGSEPGFFIIKHKYFPMIIGIFCASAYLQIMSPICLIQWKEFVLSKKTLMLVLLVMLVRVYGAFVESKIPGGDYVMVYVRNELASWGIPIVLVIMLLPYLAGLTSGLAIGMVGASFPVVINLIGADPSRSLVLSTVVLAYGFGYMGMILCPVHVCLIVTNEYFKTSITQSILRLVKPALIVLAGAVIISMCVRYF